MKLTKNKDGKNSDLENQAKPALADFLKEKIKESNLSPERLSELTKIQIYYIEALEAGEIDKLPPSVYRAGIFKRLSKFLGIDENKVIEMYKNESQTAEKSPPNASNAVVSGKNSYFILTPRKITIFFGGMLLILVAAYLWYQFDFLIGPPTLAIEPKEDMVIKDDSLLLKGKTDNGVNLTINGEGVYVSSDGNFSKNIQLAAGLNVIEIKSVNSFGKTNKIIRQIFKETQ